jgi:hypothetical protein
MNRPRWLRYKNVRNWYKTVKWSATARIEGYMKDLTEEIESKFLYEAFKRKEDTWQKLEELRFEGKEKRLENYSESTTIENDRTIIEDEYLVRTTWKRKIPTQEKPVIVNTVVEKIANEGMDQMYNFLKRNMQGRIYRKPRDLNE